MKVHIRDHGDISVGIWPHTFDIDENVDYPEDSASREELRKTWADIAVQYFDFANSRRLPLVCFGDECPDCGYIVGEQPPGKILPCPNPKCIQNNVPEIDVEKI